MSAASHTPGLLTISTIGVGFELESEGGEVIAQAQQMISEDRIQGLALRKENARRLAAAWNACNGIGTAELESEGSAALGWVRTASKLVRASRQRDDLMAVLKQAIAALETCTPGDYSTGHVIYPSFDEAACDAALAECRAAILKATGGEQ